jgi:16S rRNA G966 N2-methylase RsmD
VTSVEPSSPPACNTDKRILELEAEVASLRTELAAQERKTTFGLVWEDKPEKAQDQMERELPVLRAMPSKSVGVDTTCPHLLIEGDNLHALLNLQYTHTGSVDVIYIDPPYNTGNEFRYSDRIVGEEDEWRHSKWLSFMHRRLRLAHPLLRDTGVILIAIDDREQAHLKLLCDQIFGPRNFIAQVVWTGPRKGKSRFIQVKHDYMLVYARDRDALSATDNPWKEAKDGADRLLAEVARLRAVHGSDNAAVEGGLRQWLKSNKHLRPGVKSYCNVDSRGVYAQYPLIAPKGGRSFAVRHPTTQQPCLEPERGWSVSPETMDTLRADGKLIFGPDHTTTVYQKYYLDEHLLQDPLAVFEQDRSAANAQLRALLGPGKFDYPKDVSVLQRWFSIVCNKKDAVFLDFFAGSGSTGHAVASLNAADGGTRQAILVTNNESSICTDVTHPRMKAVLSGDWHIGKRKALPGSLRYYRCEFVSITRNRDTMLRRLASRAADIVAIRENTHERVAHKEGKYTTLTDGSRVVVVWCDWSDDGLADVLTAHAGSEENVVYLFSFGETADPDILAAHPDWRVEVLPEPFHVAIERAHARSRAR